ncbi:MAG TPA: P22 phage major capsid protein family protein [Turneriella sp.]|nr:P22 phage major capsid protein family protein [Turneriella sp.]
MAIANTLTGLVPTMYRAMHTVSRENVGALPGATIDASAAMAAKDQTVRTPVAPAATAESITPAMAVPETGGQTISYIDMTLSKSKAVPIPFSGEEELSLGDMYQVVMEQRIAQAIRTLVNEMESDLCTAAYTGASRAYGTPATTPFASSLADAAEIKRILDVNGAPGMNDPNYRSLVINSAAGVNLRKLTNLMTVNANGSDQTLRNGILLPVVGFGVRESAGVVSHTKGAGTGYDVNNASGEAVGQTTITLDGGTVNSTGIKAGDIVTFATDANNKYVVNTGLTSTTGDIVIGNPGIQVLVADTTEMTIGDSYTANFGFSKNALVVATRAPAMPRMGDLSVDVQQVTDPVTGIVFTFAMYRGYHAVRFEVSAVWGVKAVQSEHIAVLIG